MNLGDVMRARRISKYVWEIAPRKNAKAILAMYPPILRPYHLEVRNAAANKRAPVLRTDWEKPTNLIAGFDGGSEG